MPPIASSSWSRSSTARAGRGRGPARSTRSAMFRPARALAARRRCRGDARLSWRGANVGLATAPAERAPLEAATYVVVDLETTGLSPALARSARSARCGCAASSSRSGSRRSSTRAGRCRCDRGSDRDRRRRPARRAAGVELAVAAVPAFAGRRRARRPQRALRHRLPRPRGRAADGRRIAAPVVDTVWLARRLLAGRLRASGSRRSRTSSARARGRATGRFRTREATAEILLAPDRPRAGARRARRSPTSPTSRRRARAAHGKRSLVAGAPQRPGSTSSATRTSRCSTSAGPATSARGFAPTSAPSGSGRPSRLRWRARAGRVARARLRARGGARGAAAPPRAAAAGERPQRPGPTATSTCAGAEPAGRDRHARPARAAEEPRGERARRSGARRLGGRARRRAALAAREAEASRTRPPLRGRRAAARPDRRARGGRGRARRARSASRARALPARPRGRSRASGAPSSSRAAASPPRERCRAGAAGRAETEAGLAVGRARRGVARPADMDELLLIGSFLRRPPPELRIVPLAHLRRAA